MKKKDRKMYANGGKTSSMDGGAPKQGRSGTQPAYGNTVKDAMPKGSAN